METDEVSDAGTAQILGYTSAQCMGALLSSCALGRSPPARFWSGRPAPQCRPIVGWRVPARPPSVTPPGVMGGKRFHHDDVVITESYEHVITGLDLAPLGPNGTNVDTTDRQRMT